MIDRNTQIREFEQRFGCAPTFQVFSPGRVNLIGEHTDYNMLPVLPMAINHGISIIAAPSEDAQVCVENCDTSYPGVAFDLAPEIAPSPNGASINYMKAAAQFVAQKVHAAGSTVRGLRALIISDLPPAAGMSSSSAMVVGMYLALAEANGFRLPRAEEPEAMRLAERYVGTASGGMDQATILLGQEGKALFVDFDPVRAREVALPSGVVFFAVDSQQRAAKSGEARYEYNRRTFECQSSMAVLAKHIAENAASDPICASLGAEASAWTYLRDVRRSFAAHDVPVREFCARALGMDPWAPERVREVLGDECDVLLARKMLPPRGDKFYDAFPGFFLYQRAVHVIEEADRVDACAAAFAAGDLKSAADYIRQSHVSCRDLYQISTPRIEKLVADAQACGALAARITGAGFGGSIVAMVSEDNADDFRSALWAKHFVPLLNEHKEMRTDAQTAILDCRPSQGARVHQLQPASLA